MPSLGNGINHMAEQIGVSRTSMTNYHRLLNSTHIADRKYCSQLCSASTLIGLTSSNHCLLFNLLLILISNHLQALRCIPWPFSPPAIICMAPHIPHPTNFRVLTLCQDHLANLATALPVGSATPVPVFGLCMVLRGQNAVVKQHELF